ncbi:mitochondrial rho gtpase 1 [Quercus suber]|uniref:Mitochondrial rho gtpase 1 n=1 Tax=Quercus suber TaxID=58331 RepID=A0AAW0JM16_QUESU
MTMIPTPGLYTEHHYPPTSSSSDPVGPSVGTDTPQPDTDVPDENPPPQPSPPRGRPQRARRAPTCGTGGHKIGHKHSSMHDDEPKDDAPQPPPPPKHYTRVPEVFYYAQKAVLHPTGPLFDQENQCLRDRCRRALRRIFILCDHDLDGALNDAELNEFQVKCFNAPLQPAEIVGVKRVVHEKVPAGVNQLGLTLTGFLYLHALFIEKGRIETTWAVLRKFGYDDDLKLRDDFLPVPSKRASDQDEVLQPSELDELFCTAPESPWDEAPYKYAAERTDRGEVSLNGFLSQVCATTIFDSCNVRGYFYQFPIHVILLK